MWHKRSGWATIYRPGVLALGGMLLGALGGALVGAGAGLASVPLGLALGLALGTGIDSLLNRWINGSPGAAGSDRD